METINIGTSIDVQKLIDTRLLLQAGSGGGKSHAMRKLIESIGNSVQQIVIDPEGEFVTIREKFNFALVSKDGDITLNLRYAQTLAHKLLETGLSVIIDLYELKAHERVLFVKLFVDALVNAPKELWHSCFVYVDEAHVFCPESSKSEAMGSIIDLCTRGRKRGFSAILATQRLSKLHKDAAAECLNKMIGRTGLDIDRKRAADELGMTGKADIIGLRDLVPGEFFAFGPAISNEVRKFKVDKVITTHLQSGRRLATKPPTPDAVKKIVSKLADLPAEAEQELVTRQQYQAEITRLKGELTKATKQTAAAGSLPERFNKMKADYEKLLAEDREIKGEFKKLNDEARRLKAAIEKIQGITVQAFDIVVSAIPSKLSINWAPPKANKVPPQLNGGHTKEQVAQVTKRPHDGKPLGKCSREIIRFLASIPDRKFSKVQVAVVTGYSVGSGGFNNSLAELNTAGFIIRDGNLRVNTDRLSDIEAAAGPIEQVNYDISTFRANLGKCEREIYDVLLANPETAFTKEDLAGMTETEYSPNSGGFNNALSRLNTLELVKRERGNIQLNPELAELL